LYVEELGGLVLVVFELDGVGNDVVVPLGGCAVDGTKTTCLVTWPGSVRVTVRVTVFAEPAVFVVCALDTCACFEATRLSVLPEVDLTFESEAERAFLWIGEAPRGDR